MEKIAEINHNILVKLPLGFQSMIKSLPFSDFSLLFSGLSLVIIVMILTINIYSQVAKEILLQRYENHQIPAEIFIENSARVNNFKNKRKNNQNKRTNIFYSFLQKKNTVLFATDIAARGIDFPSVDWVIQLDCPDSVETYVHRVGRTARYKSKGNSLLFVNKKEENFVQYLKAKDISIKGIKININ